MRRSLLPPVLLPLVLLTGLLPGSAQAAAPVGPAKKLALAVKQSLVKLHHELNLSLADFALGLGQLRADVLGNVVNGAAAQDALAEQLAGLQSASAQALNDYSDALEAAASDGLAPLPDVPDAFLVGQGLLRSALAKAHKQVLRQRARAARLLRRMTTTMEKHDHYDLVLDARPPLLPPFTPNATGTAAPAPRIPLRIDLALSGGTQAATGDGLLIVGGRADPDHVDEVTVSIVRPGDAVLEQTVSVEDTSGRWQARLQNLPRGDYAIDVNAAGTTISDSLGVP